MTKLLIALTVLGLSHSQTFKGATPTELLHVKEIKEAAGFGDAEHRGPPWYSIDDSVSGSSLDRLSSETSSALTSSDETRGDKPSGTDSASSAESNEEKIAPMGRMSEGTGEIRHSNRAYRVCTPCAHDMLKKHTNLGIKWICGGYQRARRTFKSECMMRFRNCQDGTMFIKIADQRCRNDTYHGRHWFYIYRV